MCDIRWDDLINQITKAERKYNIKNPHWDDDFTTVFKDYGFVPIDAKGQWWTRIPDKPDLPIIYAPIASGSYSTIGAIEGTSSTYLIDSVSPVIDAKFTEISAGETVVEVTTAGAVTATSSAVATGAAAAALGFKVGIDAFEAAPEFWTKVSNAVFGTDLDPEEIGEMTRDTNALAIIVEGVVYLAEDLVTAIRTAFFDNGAGSSGYDYPSASTGESITVNVISSGNIGAMLGSAGFNNIDTSRLSGTSLEYFEHMLTSVGECQIGLTKINDTQYALQAALYEGGTLTLPYETTVLVNDAGINYINLPSSYTCATTYYTQGLYLVLDGGTWKATPFFPVLRSNGLAGPFGRQRPVGYQYSKENNIYASSINTVYSSGVDGLTPDGTQGTKDQPLAVVFPEWVDKAIETIAGDGKTRVKWLPVSIPNNNPIVNGNPFTGDQAREGAYPDNYTENANKLGEQTEEATKNAPSYPTPSIPSTPTVTPTPDDPTLIGGGGSLTGLANLYNPTLAQVKGFSRWLWGADGLNIDQLKKLLQDPMQAIIGLHVLYATPTTGSERGIQVGYINSGVSSKIVTEQYATIDCGTVTVSEYYGDARDYSPYTQVYCYLPFIGIVELNADDVINSNLSVTYKVDVLTGTCLAQLKVIKYGLDAVLYTYTGNAAVQMPITSGSYLSTVASLIGAVGGVIATAATGGALAPVVAGTVVGAASGAIKSNVAMSGSLGANAGAMGIRKPYLIIKRPEQADATGYSAFYGYPTNKRVKLSEISGYCRVKDINLSVAGATEEEQQQIVALLKEGVII